MDLLWQAVNLHSGMRDHTHLNAVSDDELLRRLREILSQSRRTEADLVAHVAEVDARKLYLREAAPSMYAYCTERLHLSEAEAWLRIRVARASRKHPMILPMLRDGRLHLSGIVVLAPHLTAENGRSVLKRAVHKTKRQIEELVAEIAPREDVPARMRKLPARRGQLAAAQTSELSPETVEAATARLTPDTAALTGCRDAAAGPTHTVRPDEGTPTSRRLTPDTVGGTTFRPGSDTAGRADTQLTPDAVVPPAARSVTVEPLAPARFRIQFTASTDLRDKLERLRALVRSSVPDGDLATVIDIAVTREIERIEGKRFGKTKTPRKRSAETQAPRERPAKTPRKPLAQAPAKSRHIPAAVKRAVHQRDQGRCTYRDRHGRRCTKRHDLEFHHREPFGRGGDHRPENLALMCRAHNALMAEEDYGREKMARFKGSASRLPMVVTDHREEGAPTTQSRSPG